MDYIREIWGAVTHLESYCTSKAGVRAGGQKLILVFGWVHDSKSW